MSLRFSLTLLTAFLVLLAWTSSAHGAAIDRNLSPARLTSGEEARVSGVDLSNDDSLRRDAVVFSIKPEGENLVRRVLDAAASFSDDWYTLAARTSEVKNEEMPVDDNLPRRWYTLIEIADSETEESE